MVYQLYHNHMKISAGYEVVDQDRPFRMGWYPRVEPSVKFLRPNGVDWQARRFPNPMTSGYPVDPTTVPRMVRWCDDHMDRAPDVDSCCATLLVSERVRELIERFDASTAQFLPVDIYLSPFNPNDAPAVRSYFLVVGKLLDAVSTDHTHYPRDRIKHPDGRTEPGMWDFEGHLTDQPKGHGPIVFERRLVSGHHLWIDRDFGKYYYPFVSDELGKALLSMDLYGAKLQHFEEA